MPCCCVEGEYAEDYFAQAGEYRLELFSQVDQLEPVRILATDLVLVRSIFLYSQERV